MDSVNNMRDNEQREMDRRQRQSVASWPLIIICLIFVWPLGLYLLYSRFRVRKYTGGARKASGFMGVILLFIGAIILSDAIQAGWYYSLSSLIVGTFFLLGGLWIFGSGRGLNKSEKYYQKYANIVGDREAVAIGEIADAMGVTPRRAVNDLEQMIDKGFFGPTAFIDKKLFYLLRSADGYKYVDLEEEPAPKQTAEPDRFTSTLREIRKLNDQIADAAVSAKIERIEAITAKIFRAAEDDPSKLDDIQTFLNYYLPTTLKLLRTYSQLERQGESGDNIRTSKKKIEGIMDELIEGFQRILDHLYRADAMDISADIEVLERMMAKDGFSDKNQIKIQKDEDM